MDKIKVLTPRPVLQHILNLKEAIWRHPGAHVPGPVPDKRRRQSMIGIGALAWENGSPKSRTLSGFDTGARKSMFGWSLFRRR
ncbi:hypothetical protein KC368_g47 [Hortaea werneckii]|nr:hypothetical protein KC368_g47 [Hortaea werneckii]